MIACVLVAAPKLSPEAGMPPITPGSAVSVTRSITRSSAATAATPSGMPMPRLTTALALSSSAARRAMILRSLISIGAIEVIGTRISPANAGLNGSANVCMWYSGFSATHHAVDEDAGDLDLARVERAAVGDALDLHDDEAAGVARGHGDGERLQRQRLALHRDVAVGVGGGAAHDGDIDREGLVEEVLLAVDLHQPHELVLARGVDLAAAVARIGEGAEPHAREVPGLPAAMSR